MPSVPGSHVGCPGADVHGKKIMSEIVKIDAREAGRVEDSLPAIGEWFWLDIKGTKDFSEGEEPPRVLACVRHVASNHIEFCRANDYGGQRFWRLKFDEFFQKGTPAPDWQEHIMKDMARVQLAIQTETRKLQDAAISKSAIVDVNATAPGGPDSLLPAVVTHDPQTYKAGLIDLKKRIPEITKTIDGLAKEYAALAIDMCIGQRSQFEAVVTQLDCLNDKIFAVEIYAGLQEMVKQIREGTPAPIDTPITIRQAFLFMDEETMIDYDQGGMDFKKLKGFDEWVSRPENISRVLPEPRGIVAFRIRRDSKDYGKPKDLWDALAQMEKNEENMKTYLVIRNGGNIYRIASAIDFWPRLIPLRTEFDDAFKKKVSSGWWNEKKNERDPDVFKDITPDDFEYDEKSEELRTSLIHYQRIVLLLQGLIDRSEVFHPHANINLISEPSFQEWINLVRDEEDALEGELPEHPRDYLARINATLKPGDLIYSDYADHRRRGYYAFDRPKFIRVFKCRKGRESDRQNVTEPNYSGRDYTYRQDAKGIVGCDGVEVEWPWGYRHGYEHGDWGKWGEWPVDKKARLWIPLTSLINVMGYTRGDYKKFLSNRKVVAEYLKWFPRLLAAEDFHLGRRKEEPAQSQN